MRQDFQVFGEPEGGLDIGLIIVYTIYMQIEFDPDKSARNRNERQLPFDKAAEFQWESAILWPDVRKPYPETRMVGLGYIGERLHIICFVPIEGGIRVISLRKANAREEKRYETQTIDR